MNRERIVWIDVVKGLLIMSVILGHCIQETLKVRELGFDDNFWRNLIYSFHMPAFMAMSGYVAYRPDRINGGGKLYLIAKRFRQLIIPFILWSIPLFLICKNVDNLWDYVLYPNNGFWFLWALFFIIVVFEFTDNLCQKIHIKQEIGITIVAGFLIGTQLTLPDAKFLGYEYIAYYFIFYMMGFYCSKYNSKMPKNIYVVGGLFALWFILAFFWTPNGIPFFLKVVPYVPSVVVRMLYRMIVPVVFIIAMVSAGSRMSAGVSQGWRLLIEFGQVSLGIYVVHMVVKNLFAQWIILMFPNLSMVWCVLIEFVILTILSLIVVRQLMKIKITSRYMLGK